MQDRLLDRLATLEENQSHLLKEQHQSTLSAQSAAVSKAANSFKNSNSNNGTLTAADGLEAVLEEHHARTRQTVIFSTLMVAVFTPLAVFAASKVF